MDSLPFGIEGYRLIRAGPGDKEYVLRGMRETVVSSVPDNEKELCDLWIGDILNIVSYDLDTGKMDNEAFILVSDDGNNAGVLWMGKSRDHLTCDDTGYLMGLLVEKEFRRRGLGTELVRSAEHWCRSKDLLSMTLNVGAVNEAAAALYRKAGYEPRSIVMKRTLK